MTILYKIPYSSIYDEINSCYSSLYWTLNNHIKLRSVRKFSKGDTVEIRSIENNIVDIFPVDFDDIIDKCLVTISPTVPTNIDSNYIFNSSDVDILLVLPVTFNGNKSYILLVGVPIGKKSIVTGIDSNTNDKMEFIIEPSYNSRKDGV
jgi:hypothetical protein